MSDYGDAFIASLDRRVSEVLDRCSRCGRCVEVCPTAAPAGIDTREPATIVGDVLDILRGAGDATSRGARWAQSCTGSGQCLSVCGDGVNPRFMLAATRLELNQRRAAEERRATGQTGFRTMSAAVKVLSRLQLPAELLARLTRPARAGSGTAPEIVMYLGCNVLKTPHIALLCLEVLDRIGARYEVFGGPANCCGVIQYRAGDARVAGQIGGNTLAGFAATGASRVLTWCPTCNIQLSEIVMPAMEPAFALQHVVPFIASRIELLRPHFVHPVRKRAALHEHPGVAGVTEGAMKILQAIPGLELVDLGLPRVGYMCNSLAPVPAYKRELHARELDAAAAAGVDCLVGIYHACHRELCAHEAASPFKIVNFLELVGEAMGVERQDLFKQWKMMQDVDRVLAEVADQAAAAGLELEAVREVLVAHMLREQPLPVGSRQPAASAPAPPRHGFFPE
ncbi:MAG TPA: (Fe-S)-binding protein [candidate division Zixibacteria bacterium]|nr:(Fe-S)-binding protein [candidate division Zixibacteria bacterium]